MIKWNEVTWYSKLLAVIFFIGILPAWTFYLGIKYQEAKQIFSEPVNSSITQTDTSSESLSKNSISNWKIYKDENFSFEFNYPPTVHIYNGSSTQLKDWIIVNPLIKSEFPDLNSDKTIGDFTNSDGWSKAEFFIVNGRKILISYSDDGSNVHAFIPFITNTNGRAIGIEGIDLTFGTQGNESDAITRNKVLIKEVLSTFKST